MSTSASAGDPSPQTKPSTFSGRRPQKGMPRSGLAQSEDVGQRGTLDPSRRDGSLTSSSRSVQSLASYDFSKLDRLDDSLNTPGIVRSAASNSSQQDLRTLPDEKGFSIQIGSELFRLSGASIMSDGRLHDILDCDEDELRILEHPRTSLPTSSNSCNKARIVQPL